MHDKRPSDGELAKRIKEAKQALKNQPGLFPNPAKAVGELNALQLDDSDNVWSLISELLEEVSPKNYVGGCPPQKSYEKTIVGFELFAFSWMSQKLKKKMYIKFFLHPSRSAVQEGED